MYVIVLLSQKIICYLCLLLQLLRYQIFDKWVFGIDDTPVGMKMLLHNGISVWLCSLC